MEGLRAFLAVVVGCGCATITPAGSRVVVYRAPLDDSGAASRMPAGCRLLAAKPPVSMTEFEMEGQRDPYAEARNQAASAGGNVLLVRARLVHSRHDFECPAAAPITDCPGSSGAWFRVVVESYVCPPDVQRDLATPPSP